MTGVPDAVRGELAALGVRLDVSRGPEAALRAVIDAPRGHVTLR
ncbi:hypothetical protein SAMN05444920_106219 [Nonomuraea solani]|uniref:Uncharacterized protein n=1 Tax=Nonomuraea solani TaxID=1144553 RepID=A0A1H6DST3_9ACTN|nr:hypothetical protein [Nonomuraea solani]SEG88309.1 hypothetical protein SAMN05444920_106219 [Nonomuraea solani]